jgi:hypothetical protein
MCGYCHIVHFIHLLWYSHNMFWSCGTILRYIILWMASPCCADPDDNHTYHVTICCNFFHLSTHYQGKHQLKLSEVWKPEVSYNLFKIEVHKCFSCRKTTISALKGSDVGFVVRVFCLFGVLLMMVEENALWRWSAWYAAPNLHIRYVDFGAVITSPCSVGVMFVVGE